jgi:hypothetical protein
MGSLPVNHLEEEDLLPSKIGFFRLSLLLGVRGDLLDGGVVVRAGSSMEEEAAAGRCCLFPFPRASLSAAAYGDGLS